MDEGDFPTDSGEYFLWESFSPHQPPIPPPKQPNLTSILDEQRPSTAASQSVHESAIDCEGLEDDRLAKKRTISMINNYNPYDLAQRNFTMSLDDFNPPSNSQNSQLTPDKKSLPHQDSRPSDYDFDSEEELNEHLVANQPFLRHQPMYPTGPIIRTSTTETGVYPLEYPQDTMIRQHTMPKVTSPAESGMTTSPMLISSVSDNPSLLSTTLFRLDRRNCCIFTILLILLLLFVFLLAFVLGTYLAITSNKAFMDEQPNMTFPITTTITTPTIDTEGRFGTMSLTDFPDSKNTSLKSVDIRSVYPPDNGESGYSSLSAYYAHMDTEVIYRLPKTFIPQHYDLYLDLTRFIGYYEIKAVVSIMVRPVVPSDEIVLHADTTLNIHTVDLFWYNDDTDVDEPVRPTNWTHDTQRNVIRINTKDALQKYRSYKIRINYHILITCEPNNGIMCIHEATDYGNGTGRVGVRGFTTKFEPTMAKTMVPCWDEPQYKAIFNITMRYPRSLVALTNTAVYETQLDYALDHVTTYHYETPPMSTYLLSFAMGDFVKVESVTKRGIPMSIYCLPNILNNMKYSLDFAVLTLDRLEAFFKIKYPLSKMDFVAAPAYAAAAMENWGLVIFTDSVLVVDSRDVSDTNTSGRYLVYTTEKIIAHELLHQWFGNLVTLDWWSEIWLNEGITTHFIPKFLSKEMTPFYRLDDLTGIDGLFRQDSSGSRFSLYQTNTESVRDLNELFTSGVYMKGGLVTSLMEQLRGETQFQADMRLYIRKNQYTNVNHSAVWESLPYISFANKTVKSAEFLHNWLHNEGLPVITIVKSEQGTRLKITQTTVDSNHYRDYIPKELDNVNGQLWKIPLNIMTTDEHLYQLLMDRPEIQIPMLPLGDVTVSRNDTWILANPELKFPFRVNYDLDFWQSLIDQLKKDHTKIPIRSRVQLMIDADAFLSETKHVTTYLSLLEYLAKENEPEPMIFGIDAISRLLYAYRDTRIHDLLLIHFKPVILRANQPSSMAKPDEYEEMLRHQRVKTHARAQDLYCLVANCTLLTQGEMQNVLNTINYKNGDNKNGGKSTSSRYTYLYEMFNNACFCLGRYPHLYRDQINMLFDDLLMYGLSAPGETASHSVYGATENRNNLALCAASGNNEQLWDKLQRVPDLYRSWPLLLLEEPHMLPGLTARQIIWQSLIKNKSALMVSHLRGSRHNYRRLLHSVSNLNELKLAVQFFGDTLYTDQHLIRAKLSWLHDEAVPLIYHYLLKAAE